MPSMGMLGAISGGAQGFTMALKEQMEEARAIRLEELRTKNSRETNKIDADQRHGQRLAEMEVGNKQDLSKLEKGHQYSLAQLKQSDEDARAREEISNQNALSRSAADRAGELEMEAHFEPIVVDGQTVGKRNKRTREEEYFPSANVEKFTSHKVEDTDPTTGSRYTTGFRTMGDRGTDRGYTSATAPPAGQTAATQPAPFKTMADAVAAAKQRYPQYDEAQLKALIAQKYPDLK